MATDSSPYRQAVPEEVLEAWLRVCAVCDGGLPSTCTCPTGDVRTVIAALVIERDALRAMLSEAGLTPSDKHMGCRSTYQVAGYSGQCDLPAGHSGPHGCGSGLSRTSWTPMPSANASQDPS